jgi:hypothetical protein
MIINKKMNDEIFSRKYLSDNELDGFECIYDNWDNILTLKKLQKTQI